MKHNEYMKYLKAVGPLDDSVKALLYSLWDLGYAQGLKEGVELEREACANLLEGFQPDHQDCNHYDRYIAKAIRARSETV
jgi:hypothetical protein